MARTETDLRADPAGGRSGGRLLSEAEQPVGPDQGGAQQRESGRGHGRSGEGRDEHVGAGAGGDVAGEPAAGQDDQAGYPQGAGHAGALTRDKERRRREGQDRSPDQQGQEQGPRDGGSVEHRKAGQAAVGIEMERLSQNLLPQRRAIKTERHAGVCQQRPGTVKHGNTERNKKCGAGKQCPPNGAAAPAQEDPGQDNHDGRTEAAATAPLLPQRQVPGPPPQRPSRTVSR